MTINAQEMFNQFFTTPPDVPLFGRPLTEQEITSFRLRVRVLMQGAALGVMTGDDEKAQRFTEGTLRLIRDGFIIAHGRSAWEAEKYGILNWIIEGIMDYRVHRLEMPPDFFDDRRG